MEHDFQVRMLKEKKQRVLIAGEVSELAFEENLIDIAMDASQLCIKEEWDQIKDRDLIVA